jgi:hypothetical protein
MKTMNKYLKPIVGIITGIIITTGFSCQNTITIQETSPIKIYEKNPFFWEYKGEPVLLIGGSREDNLFNHPENLAEHLDLLKSAGGNYIRNTMSSRNPGNLWPFKKLPDGKYDLEQWDDEYWERFNNLLQLCRERDIIVQVEIWDPWDLFKSEAPLGHGPENTGWESCPYNPLLNINYSPEESGLDIDIDYYPGVAPTNHLFFHTVPELKDIPVVLQFQKAFVDKLISISFKYPNVLYCMNNEIGEPAAWGEYWARHIRNKADEAGINVNLADMRRNSNFNSAEQIKLLHDRDNYDFFEISQNNANVNQQHYDFIISIREQIISHPKPLNNVKVYGGGESVQSASVIEGTRRFWRNIFGGAASSRFHRQGATPFYSGAGLSELALTHIRSMRMLADEMNIFNCIPSGHLLLDCEPNEAFCLAEEGRQYAIYFTDGGKVMLNLSELEGEIEIRWLDISNSTWHESRKTTGSKSLEVTPPDKGQWAVLIMPST